MSEITSRNALIDNATLSGVERLTGASKTLNLNYTDGDIVCLEKLVTAILFSDRLIAVDDYKSKFRSNRIKNFEFVEFLDLHDDKYRSLSMEAAFFAKEMAFSFEGSKPAGDVVSFFEALRIDPQLRWSCFVSSEYLTLSYLLRDTKLDGWERSVDSLFRNEDTDRMLSSSGTDFQPKFGVAESNGITEVKKFIGRILLNNSNSKGTDGKGTIEKLIFGYGWAAERSHFYHSVAEMFNAEPFLAPLRDAFCESCYRIDYHSDVSSLIENLKRRSHDTLVSILEPSGQAKFAMRLPFFTAYLISRTRNAAECIDLALDLRSKDEFQDCRTIFQNLQHLPGGDRIKEINGIMQYLEQSLLNLMKKYAVETANGIQFSLSLGLSGLNMGVSGKMSGLLRSYKNRPFSLVFRNLAQDMLNVERLGGLHDKLCSSIREHEDAHHPRITATPKFMENRSNKYGRPVEQ